ncbi:MAG: 2,3-bisphosphoglycerate-independent phosphoglycerate mutase [Peptostreptococcaceae bacterium]|nr:2,3-bisphosphoglycerate-independent phosphoglycerate mutase [Peptostreptococcaceae bacterium]
MRDFPRPTMLLIMDGYGETSVIKGNAIAAANKPNLDRIFKSFPHTTLGASGLDVGLPKGQMGNSEVGHLNIGAGRIVYQELTKITKEIEDGTFFTNQVLVDAMDYSISKNTSLHLMGLLSDGGVHSHIDHLFALLDMAKTKAVPKVFVHCFLDGRDVPPRCAVEYINQLEAHMKKIGLGKISTVSGRYYAMDRDNRWTRVEKAYNAMTLGEGEQSIDAVSAVKNAYVREENDEFVLPTFVKGGSTVNDDDSIIMFNFRPDRAREITRAFVDDNFNGFTRKRIFTGLHYVCLTQYDLNMPNVQVAFLPQSLNNTLGEYLSKLELKQLRIAETEKYAHVTFFFNGGVELPNPNEDRILIPSPRVATYDLQPEMSAFIVTEKVLEQINSDKYDFIVLNFANADMVGHSGIFEAAKLAVEVLDKCVPKIADAVLAKGGQILLTADHGNADEMLDKDGNIQTSHSLNPVPLVFISNNPKQLREGGVLADLAPTLLDIMGLAIPKEMTGHSLISPL